MQLFFFKFIFAGYFASALKNSLMMWTLYSCSENISSLLIYKDIVTRKYESYDFGKDPFFSIGTDRRMIILLLCSLNQQNLILEEVGIPLYTLRIVSAS